MNEPKTLAKSLHTITVLQRVALALTDRDPWMTSASAIDAALAILGYGHCADGSNDPHDLVGKALARLEETRAPQRRVA